MNRCSACGHVRSSEEVLPDWQCPSCRVSYEKASKLARRTEDTARFGVIRLRHRRQRRMFLFLLFAFLQLQLAVCITAARYLPQLWIVGIIALALVWIPVGALGKRMPRPFWLLLFTLISGFAAGSVIGHFQARTLAIGIVLAVALLDLTLISWAILGSNPKQGFRVHRNTATAMAVGFALSALTVLFAGVPPLSGLIALLILSVTVGWMQYRVYRATRFTAVRDAWPLTSAVMLDWLTPNMWPHLVRRDKPVTDYKPAGELHGYSGSEGKERKKPSSRVTTPADGTKPGAAKPVTMETSYKSTRRKRPKPAARSRESSDSSTTDNSTPSNADNLAITDIRSASKKPKIING